MGRKRKLGPLARRRLWRQRLRGDSFRAIARQLGVHHATVEREEAKARAALGSALASEGTLDGKDLLKRMGRALDTFEEQLDVVKRVQATRGASKTQLATVSSMATLLNGMKGYLEMLAKAAGLLRPDNAVTVTINVAVQAAIQTALTSGATEATLIRAIECEVEWPKKPLEAKISEAKALLESLEAERCLLPAST